VTPPGLDLLRRAARKPPRYLLRRLREEAVRETQVMAHAAARRDLGPLGPRSAPPGDLGRALDTTARAAGSLGAWRDALAYVRGHSDWAENARWRGQLAARREVEVFGDERVAAGVPPRWNQDLRTGDEWPQAPARRIDYVNPGRRSDVKVAWELNRLRYLVDLAVGAALGKPGWARLIDDDLRSWRTANPVGWSVNWSCAMEVALRGVNLICADAILTYAGLTGWDRPALVRSLYQHGWYLRRNLEVSDVNGNHFVADAVGLVWLGTYFAGIGEAPAWRAKGCVMLEEAARDQILEDGLDHEGSLPYHMLVLEMMLVARHAAGPAIASIDDALSRALDAAAAICRPDGRVPDLGDDDGGRVLAFADLPSHDARRVLALGRAVLGRDPDGPPSARVHADVLWLRGPGALPAPSAKPAAAARRPCHLRTGGIAVLGDDEDQVTVHVGPVGFRGRGGHGHLDAMSFEAVLGANLAVRDSGTGSYTGDPAGRNALRAHGAHSVVQLDGLPYAQLGGPARLWAIEGDSIPVVEAVDGGGGWQRLVVRQDLPAHGGAGRWTRSLTWRRGVLDVDDVVEIESRSDVVAYLHLPPECTLEDRTLRSTRHRYEFLGPRAATLVVQQHPWSRAYASTARGLRVAVSLPAASEAVCLGWRITSVTRDDATDALGPAPTEEDAPGARV